MNPSTKQLGFGLLIAFTLPGFIVLAGLAPFSPMVAGWLQPLGGAETSFGAPLYAMLVAITIGMIVSCFRWLLLDEVLLRWTGVQRPVWDDDRLEERLAAFSFLVEAHYRFAQFYGNTLLAVIAAYTPNRLAGTSHLFGICTDAGVLILCTVMLAGSRDAMLKYYNRTIRVIGEISEKGGIAMTNGNQQDGGGSASNARPRPEAKSGAKAQATPAPKPNARQAPARQR
jgi:hypothetical protein